MLKFGIAGISLVVVLGTVIYFVAPDGEGEVLQRLREVNINPVEYFSEYEDSLKVRSMIIGDITKPKLALIHGSPGDWSNWELIIGDSVLRQKFCIVAIDRAGFGKTTVPAQASLARQAAVVWSALNPWLTDDDCIVVGHSYGGAVVEQLLIDHGDKFSRGVLVAPTLSPDIQQPRWYNNFANLRLVKLILPEVFKASNIEMMGLPEGLEANEKRLASIEVPIYYIQGKKDVLVPYETMDYFEAHGPENITFVVKKNMNHFTPWSDPDLIIAAILD
jgi:pimeloyl-ACP methyl ester carboxylesterase